MMQKAIQNPALRAFVVNKLGAVKQFRALSISCSVVQFQPGVSPSSPCSCQMISYSRSICSSEEFSLRRMSSSNAHVPSSESSFKLADGISLHKFFAEHPPSDALSKKKCRFNDCLTEGKIELRFLIPRTTIDVLTAAGDTFLNSLRDKYGASLELADWKKPEGVLTLICRHEDAIECFKQILPRLSDDGAHVYFLVHKAQAFSIKGNDKRRLKKLLSEFDLTEKAVVISNRCCPYSTDVIVSLNVTGEKLPRLMERLTQLIADPIQGLWEPFSEKSYNRNSASSFLSRSKKQSSKWDLEGDSPDERGVRIDLPIELWPAIVSKKDGILRQIRLLTGAAIEVDKSDEECESFSMVIQGSFPLQLQCVATMLKENLQKSETGRAYLDGQPFPGSDIRKPELKSRPNNQEEKSLKKYWFEDV